MVAIEFLSGGRVSVNCDSIVQIVNDRSVIEGKRDWMNIVNRVARTPSNRLPHVFLKSRQMAGCSVSRGDPGVHRRLANDENCRPWG